MSARVADMLAGLPRTVAEPRQVRFAKGTVDREAAWFSQERDVPRGCPAWLAGERTYVHDGLYVLGALPVSYVRDTRTQFEDQAERMWYVAAWADEEAAKLHPESHTLGPWFMLQHARVGADGPVRKIEVLLGSVEP